LLCTTAASRPYLKSSITTPSGGRTIASGPHAGIGRDNPNKTPNARGFTLTEAEKKELIAFLESLTDTEFLHNPSFRIRGSDNVKPSRSGFLQLLPERSFSCDPEEVWFLYARVNFLNIHIYIRKPHSVGGPDEHQRKKST
jgi:hypothetical protein